MFSAYLFYHKSDSLDINSILKDNNKVDDVASTKEPLPSANPKQSSTVHPVQLPQHLHWFSLKLENVIAAIREEKFPRKGNKC